MGFQGSQSAWLITSLRISSNLPTSLKLGFFQRWPSSSQEHVCDKTHRHTRHGLQNLAGLFNASCHQW